ncbi:sulfotransferase family protein [Sphingomonas arantia]|uniref:Sulfotransferase family protein n=1 Tax=Sphingomonas arantia TaxID=1460676 RepID=A0ABW4U0Z9_9SPHN
MAVRRDLVFVLGMGRCGTSALTQVLALCGARLPDDLLGANVGNPRGHFEPAEALALNNGFLAQFGLTWFDPTLRLQRDTTLDPALGEAFIGQIEAFLQDNADRPLLVIKEPRIAGLAEYWFEAARRGGWTIKVIVPVRHPVEVARSLAARDGIGEDFSFALWLKYTMLAEEASRSVPRVFVDYAHLLADWKREVGRIAKALDIRLDRRRTKAVAAFLGDDMRHHVADADEPIDNGLVAMFHDWLIAACEDKAPDPGEVDRMRDIYFDTERLLRRALEQQQRSDVPIVVRRAQPRLPPLLDALINEFNEQGYLAMHPDVRAAVAEGRHASGLDHWMTFGYIEGRRSA